MSWITLTGENLLLERLSETERTALARAGTDADGAQADAAVARAVERVRGYVKARAGNVMGAAGTVPGELASAALDLALPDYATRVGGVMLDPKGLRKEAREAAITLLQDVAAGKFAVEPPAGSEADYGHPGPAIEDPVSVLESEATIE